MLSKDLQAVAADLIKQFGSKGSLKYNDVKPNHITGDGGDGGTVQEIEYYREYYESNELVEGLILNGDAKIYFVSPLTPKTSYTFVDDEGVDWSIISITPIEAQGMDIVYLGHIRK